MRRLLFPLAALCLLAAVGRADDAADAKAIVEKGLTATGRKPTDKDTAQTWKDKGVFTAMGAKMDYSADWAFQGPDKYRFALTGKFGDLHLNLIVVTAGEKVWGSEGGKTEELTGEKREYTLNEVYQLWVGTLYPLLTEKGFTLATAPGKDVAGKPANGVKVTHDKRRPITLYFDKASGLLVKSETVVTDEFQKWKEVSDEAYFEEYKDVGGGRKAFTKLRVVRDGKPLIESTMSDHKTAEKLDPKLFEKP